MANPSSRWDLVPVYGVYLKIGDTPSPGTVTFSLNSRITRDDGRVIYPDGATKVVRIGVPEDQDAAVRTAVRTAWRAADQTADRMPNQPGPFVGAAWDTWWDTVVVPAAIFTAFPASDDPDIVQNGWSVSVREQLQSGGGKAYAIQTLLAQLDLPIPGINLGTVEVPPGSPTVPAPMYAKGVPGGVAALNSAGDVVDADGNVVGGGGTALTDYSAQVETLPDYPTAFPPLLPISQSSVTGLVSDLAGRALVGHTHTSAQITDFTEAAQDAIAALLQGASGVTLAYNDAANTLTITGPGSTVDPEQVRDLMGVALVAAGLITITVNDALDTITISTTATANSTDAALRDRSTHTGTQLSTTISDFGEAVDDRVAGLVTVPAGSGLTKSYDDSGNLLNLGLAGGVVEVLLYNGTNVVDSAGATVSARPTLRPLMLIGGPESIRPSWMDNPRDLHFVTVVP